MKQPRSGERTAAERALEARDQLYRRYRSARRTRRADLFSTHAQGIELQTFAKMLAKFGPEHGEAMLTFVREAARSWLMTAPPEIRFEAIALLDERAQRLRQLQGRDALDDSLPHEPDSVWQRCKEELS